METDNDVLRLLISLAPSVPCEYPEGDAGAFLRDPANRPMSLLVGAIALYGSDSPWALPHTLCGRLDMVRFDARAVAAVDEGVMRCALAGKPALHLDPPKMARWTRRAAQVVVGQYGGGTSWIWNDCRRIEASRLVRRLMEVPGIGALKALVFAFLLQRDWEADVVDWGRLQVPASNAVRETTRRLGIGMPRLDDAELLVRMYEGLHNISKSFCVEGRPLCDACPLSAKCPRQGV